MTMLQNYLNILLRKNTNKNTHICTLILFDSRFTYFRKRLKISPGKAKDCNSIGGAEPDLSKRTFPWLSRNSSSFVDEIRIDPVNAAMERTKIQCFKVLSFIIV